MLIDGKEVLTAPNQRIMNVQKDTEYTKENKFVMINMEQFNNALLILRPNAFKLYCYFVRNKDNYTFALSSADVCRSLGITAKTYLTAFNELEGLGYIVRQNGNKYTFFEKAREQNPKIITISKEKM